MLIHSRPDDLREATGYGGLEESAAWLNLPGRGLLSVTGPDRLRFLNAMVTTDLRMLDAGQGRYTFLLDARGRVIADATVHALEEAYLLDTEAGNHVELFAHLDRFLIADEIELEDHSARYSCVGVEGPSAENVLQELTIPQPPTALGALPWDGGWVTRTSLTGACGFRLFVSPEKRGALLTRLEMAGAMPATDDDARIVRLEHGKPRWGEEITSRYLGPEIGLAGSISESKGCYLGQEVVERIRSRRLLARILVPVRISTTAVIRAGEKIVAGQRRVGEVVSAAFSPRFGQVVGLAYVQTGFTDDQHELVCESSHAVVNIQTEYTSEEVG